jgi:hypothetical protein
MIAVIIEGNTNKSVITGNKIVFISYKRIINALFIRNHEKIIQINVYRLNFQSSNIRIVCRLVYKIENLINYMIIALLICL